MKKTYIQPTSNSYVMSTKEVVLSTSGLGTGENWNSGSGDAKESMTPVSEDNASSLWED